MFGISSFSARARTACAAATLVGAILTPVAATATAPSAHAAPGCTAESGSVIRPSIYRAFGVASSRCSRDSRGGCFQTILWRGNISNVVARSNTVCVGPGRSAQTSTPWVATNPRDALGASSMYA